MQMVGNIVTMAERVDDEFTKLLQNTDAHSTDYVTKYACYVCKVPEVRFSVGAHVKQCPCAKLPSSEMSILVHVAIPVECYLMPRFHFCDLACACIYLYTYMYIGDFTTLCIILSTYVSTRSCHTEEIKRRCNVWVLTIA